MGGQGIKVLVADDSATILNMLSCFLVEEGYSVITATDGVEVVEKAVTELPDIVVLDLIMPRMNGYQSCRILKNHPPTADLPVIILTSQDHASRKYWGMQSGADAYVVKDTDFSNLLSTISEVLRKHPPRQRKAPRQGLAGDTSLDIVASANELLDSKLFESTIINEIGKIADTLGDLKGTVRGVLDILGSLVQFDVAAICLLGDEDDPGTIAFDMRAAVDDSYLSQVRALIQRVLRHSLPPDRPMCDLDEMMLQSSPKSAGETPRKDVASYRAIRLKSRGRISGLLVITRGGAGEFGDEEDRILELVAKHSTVILDNARLYDKVRRLSVTDGLLGIFNRRYMDEQLEKEFARVVRYGGTMSVMIVDLDRFKDFNDCYGHLCGDKVLLSFVDVAKKLIRKSDILGRYGGEEFVVILPQTDSQGAIRLAERLRKDTMGISLAPDHNHSVVTISIGIASYPASGASTALDLLSIADKALYTAKQSGRNRVCALPSQG